MKPQIPWLRVFVEGVVIVGCILLAFGIHPTEVNAQEPATLQPSEHCIDHSDTAVVTFEDANLEERVRGALRVDTLEDLTCGRVSGLTVLDAFSAGIESLVGIQNLTSLTGLRLHFNSITDISPLSGLRGLAFLWLNDNPGLANIQPLLDNTGLGAGDRVLLISTNVSCTDVAALEAKGARVESGCSSSAEFSSA